MSNWTEQQLADLLERRGVPGKDVRPDVSAVPFLPPSVAGAYALGRLPKGTMNKTESAYAAHLAMQLEAGEILYWKFEPTNLRLADNTFYRPDFGVLNKDSHYEFHEVKGRWTDDAKVKIKVAASQHPFKFIAIYKDGKGWKREEFSR